MYVLIETASYELLLFSACGFLLFGLDDLIYDLVWLWLKIRSRRGVESSMESLDLGIGSPRRIAVFVPAWQEANVIGAMLARSTEVWRGQPVSLFVGCYPNDPKTIEAVSPFLGEQCHLVVTGHDGPTTKADCLNEIWHNLLKHEVENDKIFDAILLHDAEDHVHKDEIALFSSLPIRIGFAQIPVIPVPDPRSRWIAGHYIDEFAEAHIKDLVVRTALGASLPSAGTGSMVARAILKELADERGGTPFDAASLTEDYELGLRISEYGQSSRFIRAKAQKADEVIAVKSCFPASIGCAVRQKTRWGIGIALAGWDRVGWSGGYLEHWMRWRDRRTIVAATFIASAYVGVLLVGLLTPFTQVNAAWEKQPHLFIINATLFMWRLGMRAYFTAKQYGRVEGLYSIPRMFVSNLISVMAAARAILGYCKILYSGEVRWDKTEHAFPLVLAR